MVVKVLITRRFQEGQTMEVLAMLNQLRLQAMIQPGYITGETLIGHDDGQKVVVVSTWRSAEHWLKWKDNPDRQAHEAKLEPLLLEPAQSEVFVISV